MNLPDQGPRHTEGEVTVATEGRIASLIDEVFDATLPPFARTTKDHHVELNLKVVFSVLELLQEKHDGSLPPGTREESVDLSHPNRPHIHREIYYDNGPDSFSAYATYENDGITLIDTRLDYLLETDEQVLSSPVLKDLERESSIPFDEIYNLLRTNNILPNTIPGTGASPIDTNLVLEPGEQITRKTNMATLRSLIGRLEGAITTTGSQATGLVFDLEPGRSQWVFSVHPSNLPAYGPESKTLSARLIVNDNSGTRIAELIDASVTHGHGTEGIIGIRYRESALSHLRSWNETTDIGRLRNLFDAFRIPPANPDLGEPLNPKPAAGVVFQPGMPEPV